MSKTTRATLALDRAGVSYTVHHYDYDPDADRIGLQAADMLRDGALRDPEFLRLRWRADASNARNAFRAGNLFPCSPIQ